MNKNITLNIVTVVWNDIDGLTRTLVSLKRVQDSLDALNLNIIIQDGLSSDGTKEFADGFISKNICEKFQVKLNYEKDYGIFDAMNRASSRFNQNDLIMYLNAGDIISEEIDLNAFYSSLIYFINDKSKISGFRSRNIINDLNYYMPSKKVDTNELYIKWLKNNTPVHQALIFKFDNQFPIHYPMSFEIQADSIMIYYLFKFQGDPIFFDITLCDFELGGLSNSYKSFRKVYTQIKEQKLVSNLRNEEKFIIFARSISLIIKFLMHNILGKRFYVFHAYLKKTFT